ncbi:MAG: TolC family protein [Flavobacteriaceae bacterium]|nr:TolC family protein [Flavobacteriaceae bacterium]
MIRKITPGILYYENARQLTEQSLSLEKQRLLPDIQFSLFQGTNNAINAEVYQGFELGLAFPLWFGNQKSQINAAKIEKTIISNELENYRLTLKANYEALMTDLEKHKEGITYYDQEGKKLAKELLVHAENAFKNGEIDYLQFVLLLENAKKIEMDYLNNLKDYNLTVLEARYLIY